MAKSRSRRLKGQLKAASEKLVDGIGTVKGQFLDKKHATKGGTYKDWSYGSYSSKKGGGAGAAGSKYGSYKACHTEHPELKLGTGLLRGGACSTPAKDFDVFVGLNAYSMANNPASYPWAPGYAFAYPIQDMNVPSDAASFVQLIAWLKGQLDSGAKVHIGCIGGHGRTGMVIAALAKEMLGEVDAIGWTRKNYCKKAVETSSQVKFLVEHFGVTSVEPVKEFGSGYGGGFWGGAPSSIPSKELAGLKEYRPIKSKIGLFTGSQGEQSESN